MFEQKNQKFLDELSQDLWRKFRDIDNTLKSRGSSSFCNLLRISTTSDRLVNHENFNKTIQNMVNKELRNKPEQLLWLKANYSSLAFSFDTYCALNSYSFFIDDDFINYAVSEFDLSAFKDTSYPDIGFLNVIYKGVVYQVNFGVMSLEFSNNVTVDTDENFLSIRMLPSELHDNMCIYNLYGYAGEDTEIDVKEVKCNNKYCPKCRHGSEDELGFKTSACKVRHMEKCDAFSVTLSPS
jgi:hypothetical protein